MSVTQPIGKQAAFATMTSLFFIWGFITALNDILIPHLKAAFELNYTQAMLVQFAFFGAYFVVSPLAGKLIESIGYIHGVVAGLATIALGCLIFYPAAEVEVYGLFLAGLFVLAAGITILQVAANPYVAALGEQKTAASRLNLAQAVNSLGHTLAPLFGAMLIFGAIEGQSISAQSVQLPYLILAGLIIATAIAFKSMNLPVIATQAGDNMPLKTEQSIWSQHHCVLGAGAIFLYVGAEVSIGSFLVNYLTESNIAAMDVQSASKMVSYYWGAAMMGRFVGAAMTRYIKPTYILAANAILAVVLLLTTMTNTGSIAVYSVIAVGFFNSIMFPTIFSLAIKDLGPLTSRGSGLLCQAIVGGAILPLVQGLVADMYSIQVSFIVPMVAYFYIFGYAQFSHNLNPNSASLTPKEANG